MVDFSALLRKPAGQAKKPPALPAGDFPGLIKSHEVGDSNKNKTPYVRFMVQLTGWPADAPAEWKDADGNTVQQADFDLSKRQMRRDFYLTDDALWRLDEFLRSCGVVLADDGSTPYEEALPQTVGAPVVAEVQQYLNKENGEVGNQLGKLTGEHSG